MRGCADKEADDQEGAAQIITNSDIAACLGSSLRLLCWDTSCVLCRDSGSQGEREKVVFSCRQVEVRVFCNHTLKGQREIKRNKIKFTTSAVIMKPLTIASSFTFSFLCLFYFTTKFAHVTIYMNYLVPALGSCAFPELETHFKGELCSECTKKPQSGLTSKAANCSWDLQQSSTMQPQPCLPRSICSCWQVKPEAIKKANA